MALFGPDKRDGTAPTKEENAVTARTGELHTLLGKGSEFDGKLSFEGQVRIDGKYTGQIHTKDVLVIGESAKVNAEISAGTHVRHLDAPVARVLSLVPERYDDLWTGAKGFYKVEPVVADGGEVVLYAPHIRQVSAMHPQVSAIGYHCRDYFLAQWDRFADVPRGDLAHATHLRGTGTYDPATGESCRVRVTLATGIPEAEVRAVSLGYLDPAAVDVAAWAADPGTLVVPDAGEVLYRLRPGAT